MPESSERDSVRPGRPAALSPRVTKRIGTIAISVILVVVALAATFIFSAPALDRADEQWVTCEAYSAHAVVAGRAAEWAVEIPSSCGTIWLSNGVDSGNARAIARDFSPHSRYRFQFGWLSRVYLQLRVSSPNAQAWRPAP
ncbi:hypothetical protein HII28_08455 [Planctomonas sp. JC2975]|uniref:hypothetical protein n=1 Tax=Planctomonas sp. JC2975 TaxID=2729626 RepID=UPI0014739191|nr:hypothetical protein [Planctomonas sp. JC2975]NNC11909.1 hypothetical protein [Planctomonas sp. JC2975]